MLKSDYDKGLACFYLNEEINKYDKDEEYFKGNSS